MGVAAAKRAEQAGPSSRDRLLDIAERLFMERGYAAVVLRDIAEAAEIRQASLYYHAPGGKEELYVAVVMRAIERHHAALRAIVSAPSAGFEEDLIRVGLWMAAEPPMNVNRMVMSDLPQLSSEAADKIRSAIFQRLNEPLVTLFERGAANGELRVANVQLAIGAFRAMMQATEFARTFSGRTREMTVRDAVDLLMRGLGAPKPDKVERS